MKKTLYEMSIHELQTRLTQNKEYCMKLIEQHRFEEAAHDLNIGIILQKRIAEITLPAPPAEVTI